MTTASILVVEDELIIAKAIEKRLVALGYSVVGVVKSGEEGLQEAANRHPDAVLMDIHLGTGIDGIDAADRIRTDFDIPVIFLTAHSDHATLERAKRSKPFGYVLKPFGDKDLQTAIEMAVYRHRVDRQIRDDNHWLAATLGSIGDAVIATDINGNVQFMNSLAEQLTGWPLEEAVGINVGKVFCLQAAGSNAQVANPVHIALETESIVGIPPDVELVSRHGTRVPVDDVASPIRDLRGVNGAVLVFRDITERKRLEEYLQHAHKMESIGRLAGGIAHDFNNILTVITAYCELLKIEDLPSEDRRSFLEQIELASQRATDLTNRVLTFSRKQMRNPVVICMNDLIRNSLGMVRNLVTENVQLELRLADNLHSVLADPTQILQVLLNLTANARDALTNGGRVVIETSNVEHNSSTPGRDLGGPSVMLSVSDNGTGIPQEVLKHIFEPYFTTKDPGLGTGLGLATVYGIVKQSKGHVEVASKIGLGTTIRVFLPRAEAEMPESKVKPDSVGTASRGNETILLVEDDDALREMVRRALTRYGYEVLVACDGRDGIAVAGQHSASIHLLLTDLLMPNVSGRELSDSILKSRPDTRVVFMSGYTDDVAMLEGIESSSVDFLRKPFTIENLTRKIREVLDR